MQHYTGPDLMIICLAAMHDSSDDTCATMSSWLDLIKIMIVM